MSPQCYSLGENSQILRFDKICNKLALFQKYLKFIFIKKEVEELGSDIHIVWKKRSDELVLCHSLMVDSFHGSKSSFFRLSLSL